MSFLEKNEKKFKKSSFKRLTEVYRFDIIDKLCKNALYRVDAGSYCKSKAKSRFGR
jgi:hypothetical protein